MQQTTAKKKRKKASKEHMTTGPASASFSTVQPGAWQSTHNGHAESDALHQVKHKKLMRDMQLTDCKSLHVMHACISVNVGLSDNKRERDTVIPV